MKKSRIIALLATLCMLFTMNLQAQNAVTYWKDGVPVIVYAPDSIFFWSADANIPEEANEGESAEPTEMEEQIMEMTSNEEEAPTIKYSEEDSLKYDAMAQEVLAMYAVEGLEASKRYIKKVESDEDLAEEAIRNNGKNIFEGKGLIIEQQAWDSGIWGNTRYGGFETYYNTFTEYGKRYLMVVFYFKGGFPNKRSAYLKLGQVNSGKIVGKATVYTGQEYTFMTVCIDDYLKGYGCVNFFPLLINDSSSARNYLNPIFVKSDPILDNDWRNKYYGYEFGTINGVSVYFNKDSYKGNSNQGDGGFQCVELCKRYVKELNGNISRRLTDTWGNAINWPYERQNDKKDPDKYIVFANDGNRRVREGDLIVWDYGKYGHIGVVIKTTETYISVAHQNGGTGRNALPIGSTLKIENGIVKDIKPGNNTSPIFASSHPINYFIRINSSAESYKSYTASLKASTTNMEFGDVEVGKKKTMTFSVTNSGLSTLEISSIKLTKNDAFSVDKTNLTLKSGETSTITVTFAPTKAGEYKDRIAIQSNAADNPLWVISLQGRANGGDVPTQPIISVTPSEIDFGVVKLGTDKTRNLTITNTGNSNVTVTMDGCTEYTECFDVSDNQEAVSLAPGKSKVYTVTAHGTKAGCAPTQLLLVNYDGMEVPIVVKMSSYGDDDDPIIDMTDLSLNIGETATVKVRNSGYFSAIPDVDDIVDLYGGGPGDSGGPSDRHHPFLNYDESSMTVKALKAGVVHITFTDLHTNHISVLTVTVKGDTPTPGPKDGVAVEMSRKYLVNTVNDYNSSSFYNAERFSYQGTGFNLDNGVSVSIDYHNANHWNGSYENSHLGVFVRVVKDDVSEEWYINPLIKNEWVDEKIIINYDGTIQYFMNNENMGTHNFDLLKIDDASTMTLDFNPYGWWYTHYHYMDDFKITTQADSFSDNFNDGVMDTSFWLSPTNPDGVKEEEGIMKMIQLRTDQDFHLKTREIKLDKGVGSSDATTGGKIEGDETDYEDPEVAGDGQDTISGGEEV